MVKYRVDITDEVIADVILTSDSYPECFGSFE